MLRCWFSSNRYKYIPSGCKSVCLTNNSRKVLKCEFMKSVSVFQTSNLLFSWAAPTFCLSCKEHGIKFDSGPHDMVQWQVHHFDEWAKHISGNRMLNFKEPKAQRVFQKDLADRTRPVGCFLLSMFWVITWTIFSNKNEVGPVKIVKTLQ